MKKFTAKIEIAQDAPQDVRILAKIINCLIDKVNELVDENNNLQKQLTESKESV